MKLSRTSREALLSFGEAAESWGWHQYQGTGSRVDASERDYLKTKEVLEARILSLEEQNRKLRKGSRIET